MVYASRGRLWRQIRWRRTCYAFETNTGRKLHSNHRVGRQTLHRYNIGLGLRATTGTSLHAGVRQKGVEAIQSHANQKTKSTIPQRDHSVRGQETVRETKFYIATIRQKG